LIFNLSWTLWHKYTKREPIYAKKMTLGKESHFYGLINYLQSEILNIIGLLIK
jgi:hypothetical protein